MPAINDHSRAIIGMHQHRCAGRDRPSALARNAQRYGTPCPGLDVRGVRNQFVLALLASTLLARPAVATASAADRPAQRSVGGLLPAAEAMDTIRMADLTVQNVDPAAAGLLGADPLQQVISTAADTAASACVFSPPRCGAAMVAGLAGAAVGAAAMSAAGPKAEAAPAACASPAITDAPPTVARIPYHLVKDALQPAARFSAELLDPGQSPCDSLGLHVNHRWETAHELEPGRSRLGTFEQLRDRSLLSRYQLVEQIAAQTAPTDGERLIGDLWVTGMDEQRIEAAGRLPLQGELDGIRALRDSSDLFAWLTDASTRARNPLFAFSVQPDMDNPAEHLAYLAQAGLGLPDSGWYTDPVQEDTVAAYRTHVGRMLALLDVPPEQIDQRAAAVLALEQQLAAVSEPFTVLAVDDSPYHNPVDLQGALAETPHMDWQRFFEAHGQPVPARFSLGMPAFFRRVDALLQTLPLQVWQDYLQFHVLERAAPALSSTYADAHAAFHDGVLKGRRAQVPRWARVLDMIERSAGEALGPAFVEQASSPAATAKMDALVANLRQALDHCLATSTMMDRETRDHARLKASRMRIDIGQPTAWLPWDGVASSRADFVANLAAADAHVHRHNIGLLDRPVDTGRWKMSPQTVDAYHDMAMNRIVIPAALLQPPFFDEDADDALNYGGIAAIIGHEMAHGFDASGGLVDADGQNRNWFSGDDWKRMDARDARLVEQFGQYRINGLAIDGEITRDENLADLGGLEIALDALRRASADTPDPMIEGMTREQRFFTNYAFSWRSIVTPQRLVLELATNNHVPGRIRADGVPSNLPAFARAFNCSEGQPMARTAADRIRFL